MSPIGARSWGVAAICSILNFLHLGTARLSGSMYLAVLERYRVDRSKASLPFILCYTVRNISGPLIGYLATKFGIYTVTILGGLIAFVGIGGCYFAENIMVVILFWGVIFGFGFGMGSVLIPEILNQHFDKYISNANGIAFGGECIAGFVLPILLKFSLNTYGTSGTFLILSGLMLNSIPATLLLRYFNHGQPSKALQRVQNQEHLIVGDGLSRSINRTNCNSFDNKADCSLKTTEILEKSVSNTRSSELQIGPIESPRKRSGNETRDVSDLKHLNFNKIIVHSEDSKEPVQPDLKHRNITAHCQANRKNQTVHKPTDGESRVSINQDANAAVSKDTVCRSYPEPNSQCQHVKLLESNSSNHYKTENQSVPIKYYGSLDQGIPRDLPYLLIGSYEKSPRRPANHNIRATSPNLPTKSLLAPSPLVDIQTSPTNPFKIFLDPAFCMILLTQSTMLYNATMFWTIIVDFSRDSGLSSREEIYILLFFSLLDMVGRLGLGWITDSGYVSNFKFSGMCCFGMGISVGSLVFFRKLATIGCSVSFFGLCLGGFLIVCPGVVNDHIHPDKRGMALASRFFLFAPMSLSQSPLIGHFRGKLGSYNFIFIILAVLCFFGSVTSLLTPYAEEYRERRSTKKGILGRNFDSIISTAGSGRQLAHDSCTKKEKPLELTGKINRGLLED